MGPQAVLKLASSAIRRPWVQVVLAALAIAAMILWISHLRQNAQEAALRAREAEVASVVLEDARRADGAALGTAAASRADIHQTEELSRAETEDALERNRAWADEPVPADVLGSLR